MDQIIFNIDHLPPLTGQLWKFHIRPTLYFTLISLLIAKKVGINEEGKKMQKETDTYIEKNS